MIRSIKAIIFFIIILFLNESSFSQSSSSYSRIGIGDIQYSYSARKLGMGQTGVAVSDVDFISINNPASLYRLRRTRLETGMNYNGIFLSLNDQSTYQAEAEFAGLTFAFPVSNDYGIGMAFGIAPYSDVSYEVVEDVSATVLQSEEYKIFYEGRGGLSKLFLGTSYKLPFELILGATLDYYFGNLNYFSRAQFTNSKNLEAEYIRTYSPRGLGSTIGLITPDISGIFGSDNFSNFNIGIAANIVSELSTDTLLTSTSNLLTDTIGIGSTAIKIPVRLAAGLSLILNTNFLISVDYVYQPWSEYRFNNISNPNLRNSSKMSAGFEYRPSRELGATFWEQIIWRSGLSFEQTQYMINGTGINQYSVSGGFSLPLSPENTFDVGLQFAMRGTTESDLYKENIIRLNLGVSLGEMWFIRQEK